MKTPRAAIIAAIKAFDFDDYGMDEVDPASEYAEWVPALADKISAALDAQKAKATQ